MEPLKSKRSDRLVGYAGCLILFLPIRLAVPCCITLHLLPMRAFPLGDSVTNGIPIDTPSYVKVFGACLVCLPSTEPGPVISESISVRNYAPYSKICVSGGQSVKLVRVQRANCAIGVVRRSATIERCLIRREEHITHNFPQIDSPRWKARTAISIDNLDNNVTLQSQCRTLARIVKNYFNTHGRIEINWNAKVHFNPSTLVNHKVMAQIAPLKVGHDSIPYGKWDGDNLQNRFPPINGLIPGILGLVSISWGWWNFRRGQRLPYSPIVFLAGCTLWIYGLLTLLPWSTTEF